MKALSVNKKETPYDKPNKISIELNNDTKQILNHAASRLCFEHSQLLSDLVNLFLAMPDDMKEDFQDYIMIKTQKLCEYIADCDNLYAREKLLDLKKRYYDMSYIIGYVSYADFSTEHVLKTIKMKDCSLTYPEDWLVLNPEEASNATHAIVVEIRNGTRYNAPNFLFLCNKNGSNQSNDPLYYTIYKKCEERWPRIKELKELDFADVIDPISKDKLNNNETLRCPHIGYFNIYHSGEHPCGDNAVPYGALINPL